MNTNNPPSLISLVDEGLRQEIELEEKIWNERLYLTEYKGTKYDRFPLSPSQIGKCALALGRNLSHYLGLSDYPRGPHATEPRVQRIFARGHLLEDAVLGDTEKYGKAQVVDRQKRLDLFRLSEEHTVTGAIDAKVIYPDGTEAIVDIKSKGDWQGSTEKFFAELVATGYVEKFDENSFYITDPEALFAKISLDEFFVDYLLQLNTYGYKEQTPIVELVYENKNNCTNYTIRWVPNAFLYSFTREKFQYIYNEVTQGRTEEIPKEFVRGSVRCRYCEHGTRCYGEYIPVSRRIQEPLPLLLESNYIRATRSEIQRSEEDILVFMEQKGADQVSFSNGLVYERKWLKSPKPHYELRLVK